jgi:shikimate dehydrogenase
MYPDIQSRPNIPYQYLSPQHLLFDMVYNPTETEFLKLGKLNGAKVKNGLEMLQIQAEENWKIWNSNY